MTSSAEAPCAAIVKETSFSVKSPGSSMISGLQNKKNEFPYYFLPFFPFLPGTVELSKNVAQ